MQEHLLDTLGIRAKVLDALAEAISESAKEGAKEIGKEYGKDLVIAAAKKSVSPLAQELAKTVGGEVAKAAAGALVGPLVGILFSVVDDTKTKINRILSEPEKTAVREARRFLNVESESTADQLLIKEKFAAVSDAFDRAYTFAQGQPDAKARMLWIRMMQGLIARHRGGKAVASLYFKECLTFLTDNYSDLETERNEIAEKLTQSKEKLEREIKNPPRKPPLLRGTGGGVMNPMGREIALEMNEILQSHEEQERREKLHKERIEHLRVKLSAQGEKASLRLNEIKKVEDFIQIVRELCH